MMNKELENFITYEKENYGDGDISDADEELNTTTLFDDIDSGVMEKFVNC